MRRVAILLAALALALGGCAHDGIHGLAPPPAMPALPQELAKPAPKLPPLTDPTLKGLVIDGAETDRAYNDVAARLNAVQRAWECVRQSLAARTDASKCFGP